MHSESVQPLVAPLPDPALGARRQTLVSALFKYVADIQEIENGFAFRFRRSEFLARRLADYLLFESRVSPQLSFVLVVEAAEDGLWLQIRGPGEADKVRIRIDCLLNLPLPPVSDDYEEM